MTPNIRRGAGSGAGLLLTIGALVVVLALVRVGAERWPTQSEPAQRAPQVDEGGSDHADGATIVMYDEGYPLGVDWSAEDSQIVAVVDVATDGALRFNTSDGRVPVPPSGLTEGWIYQAARLLVTDVLKGDPGTTGAWVPVWGGRIEGYGFERRPSLDIRAGQRGVAFMSSVPDGLRGDPWFEHLESRRDGRDSEPVMMVLNWYRFEGEVAISAADEAEMTIDALLSEVEGALNP